MWLTLWVGFLFSTKETLATGHFMSVINILMQLRKVCNHPNLFDPRPIHSPFITEGVCFNTASIVLHAFNNDPFKVGAPTLRWWEEEDTTSGKCQDGRAAAFLGVSIAEVAGRVEC